jgi:serine/threonine protein kinase
MDRIFIRNYWVREEIGRSPHSVIFHASDSETGRDVAMKKLVAPSLLLNIQKEDTIGNFRDEIKARERFSHPHVLELYDCFEHENEIYLVEELATGHGLDRYLRGGRYYTYLAPALFIIQKTAEALLEAHRHGYLHRNFKPENIMITRENDLKVTDFMVCSLLYREQKVRTILDTDQFENLNYYAAPEAVSGKKITPVSNIFSLGVLMYELFTCMNPFVGHNEEETYINIVNREAIHASVLNPALPEEVNYIIDRCLKKDPDERYGNLHEMLEDLAYFYSEKRFPPLRLNLYRSRRFHNTLQRAREFSRRFLSYYSRRFSSLSREILARVRSEEQGADIFVDATLDPEKVRKKKILHETPEQPEVPPVASEEKPEKEQEEEKTPIDEASSLLDEIRAGLGEEASAPAEALAMLEEIKDDLKEAGTLPSEAQALLVEIKEGLQESKEEPQDPGALIREIKEAAPEGGIDERPEEKPFAIDPPDALDLKAPFFHERGTFFREHQKQMVPALIIFVVLLALVFYLFFQWGRKAGLSAPGALPTKVVAHLGTSGILVTCTVSKAEIQLSKSDGAMAPIAGKLDINGNWEARELPAGDYMLVVTKSGYAPFVKSVTLKENDRLIVTAEMVLKSPSIEVISEPPGAKVLINGTQLGLSPLKAYDKSPGEYALSLELDGYETYREKIIIIPQNCLLRKISLTRAKPGARPSGEKGGAPSPGPTPGATRRPDEEKPSDLAVDSQPAVASVFVDGKEVGITPCVYTVKPYRSTVELMVKKKGYNDWATTVELTPGGKKDVFADMEGGSPIVRVPTPRSTPPPAAARVMTLSFNSRYSSALSIHKLSSSEFRIDFERADVDRELQNCVNDILREARGRGGSFVLNASFAVGMDASAGFSPYSTTSSSTSRLIGYFVIEDANTRQVLFESQDTDEFQCDPRSYEVVETGNNYNKYRMINTTDATEAAIRMVRRNEGKLSSVVLGRGR